MKVTIIGTGYVGLVTGACFAEYGNDVICVDKDTAKVKKLNNREIPIYEPGLDEIIKNNYEAKRLRFTSDIASSVETAEICFICVGTPPGEDGSADLKYVIEVSRDIGKYINKHTYIVDKSTVPVGTADLVEMQIQKQLGLRESDLTFDIISNPEFLKEGNAVTDCMRPDRIVIGVKNKKCEDKMRQLYKPFVLNSDNFICMDIRSAEMTKYAANAMLATKISFMNELSNICEKVGANINKVRKGIGSDSRIGYNFIYAGCGYGGSCFPKDVKALIRTAKHIGFEAKLLQAVEDVNNYQKHVLVQKVIRRFGENLEGKEFAVWGLAFKPNTDDMREASAITIINELTHLGAKINAYDPKAATESKEIYLKDNSNIEYFKDKYDALNRSEAMLLITEWKEFRSPDFLLMKEKLRKPIIFDGRNQYDEIYLGSLGFEYYQIGVGV